MTEDILEFKSNFSFQHPALFSSEKGGPYINAFSNKFQIEHEGPPKLFVLNNNRNNQSSKKNDDYLNSRNHKQEIHSKINFLEENENVL